MRRDIAETHEELELGANGKLLVDTVAVTKGNFTVSGGISFDILEVIVGIVAVLTYLHEAEEVFGQVNSHVGVHTYRERVETLERLEAQRQYGDVDVGVDVVVLVELVEEGVGIDGRTEEGGELILRCRVVDRVKERIHTHIGEQRYVVVAEHGDRHVVALAHECGVKLVAVRISVKEVSRARRFLRVGGNETRSRDHCYDKF